MGQTLPELTSELLSAYTTQSSELQLKEKCLQQLDSELLELQRQLQAVSGDVSSTVRSICLQEDLLARLGRECEGLESGVLALVQERENLQLQLHHLKEEKQLQDKMRAEYESKMQSYESKVEQLEKLSPTQVELEALRNKIQALKEKSKDHSTVLCHNHLHVLTGEEYYTAAVGPVLSVERQQCLQDQVAALMASRVALRQENSVLEEKVRQSVFY